MKKILAKIHAFRDPSFDWHLVLACFAILFLIVLLVDGLFYRSFHLKSQAAPTTVNPDTQFFDRKELDEAVQSLIDKDLSSSDIPEAVLHDPSL